MAKDSSNRELVLGSAIVGIVTVLVERLVNTLGAKVNDSNVSKSLPTVLGFHLQVGDGLTFVIVSTAIYIAWRSRNKSASYTKRTTVDTATLRLHTYGQGRVPDAIHGEHIFRWYYMSAMAVTTKPKGGFQEFVTSVTVFITFEPDVRISTLRVTSLGIQLPKYEVKEFNQRFAIIAFMGDIPEGTLEFIVGPTSK